MFMRSVKSRNFFEQMKGRGVRVIDDARLPGGHAGRARRRTTSSSWTASASARRELMDSKPLEKSPGVPFEKLLQARSPSGNTSPEIVSSLASRLARIEPPARQARAAARSQELAGGVPLQAIVQRASWRRSTPTGTSRRPARAEKLPAGADAVRRQRSRRRPQALIKEAARAARRRTRSSGTSIARPQDAGRADHRHVTKDEVLEAGFSDEAQGEGQGARRVASRSSSRRTRTRSPRSRSSTRSPTRSGSASRTSRRWPRRSRRRRGRGRPSCSGGPTRRSTRSKVQGAGRDAAPDRRRRRWSGSPSTRTTKLVPFAEQVEERFQNWLAQQENRGRRFTPEQREWLDADQGPHRRELRDREGRLRRRAVQPEGRAREGVRAVRGEAGAAAALN